MRSAEAIAKQKATLAANKLRDLDRQKKREERRALRTTGIKTPVPTERKPSTLFIEVDWQNIPMDEAQGLYARLKVAFERAGAILNARLMHADDPDTYECFMAGKPKCCAAGTRHQMPPRGQDYENGMKDPKTGLIIPVRICSELCWIRYQDMLITARRERQMVPRTS